MNDRQHTTMSKMYQHIHHYSESANRVLNLLANGSLVAHTTYKFKGDSWDSYDSNFRK